MMNCWYEYAYELLAAFLTRFISFVMRHVLICLRDSGIISKDMFMSCMLFLTNPANIRSWSSTTVTDPLRPLCDPSFGRENGFINCSFAHHDQQNPDDAHHDHLVGGPPSRVKYTYNINLKENDFAWGSFTLLVGAPHRIGHLLRRTMKILSEKWRLKI